MTVSKFRKIKNKKNLKNNYSNKINNKISNYNTKKNILILYN